MRGFRRVAVDWGRHPGWLVGLVAYPLITFVTAGSLFIAVQGYEHSRGAADSEAQTLARSAAFDADRFVDGRLRLLAAVSRMPVVQDGNADAMREYFQRIPNDSGLNDLSWIDRSGILRAYSTPLPPGSPVDYSDRDFVQQVLATSKPAVGKAVVGRIVASPTVPIGYPTFDTAGRLTGILATGIRLDSTQGNELHFGGVAGLRVVDGSGHLIISDGPVSDLRSVSTWPGYDAARQDGAGIAHGAGVMGESDRVIAYATAQRTGWLVLVDRPADAVYGSANSVMQLEFVGIVLFAVITGLGVAAGMVRLERDASRAVAAEEEAEAGRQLRDELIAGLGHDLGNPLTIIRGHAGLLRRRLSPDDTSPMEIEQSARRMQRMIQGLMDLSTNGEEGELARDEVDLVLVGRVLVEERRVLDRGREFVLEAPEGHIIGEWDRMRVERAVDNLLSNAVKYSTPGTDIVLRVARVSDAAGDWAVVEVEDHGIGIPKQEQERVFEAFYRGSNTSSRRGSGLGLSSVWRVARQHGGDVEIESTEGVGTKVRMRLPLDSVPEEEVERVEAAEGGL